MRTLIVLGGIAGAALLPASPALAQAISPSWDCRTDAQGQRTCRAIWDSRDLTPPPMIRE
ncbi:MAG TPA: hypothetical protein VFA64_11700 [Hyphomicrobiaceae bacterium]|nr:hypothetical protein [Hyphomicrobiaceae bacterium]